jgi:hypothetical protein
VLDATHLSHVLRHDAEVLLREKYVSSVKTAQRP